MKIKTKADYVNSLKKQHINIYYKGEQIKDRTTFPAFVPHINSAAKTYELAMMPESEPVIPIQ